MVVENRREEKEEKEEVEVGEREILRQILGKWAGSRTQSEGAIRWADTLTAVGLA